MKRPTERTVGNTKRLAHLHELARLDAQRPGNIGAGLKILEALLKLPNFRPRSGAKA